MLYSPIVLALQVIYLHETITPCFVAGLGTSSVVLRDVGDGVDML